jgi:hypothetical protein
MYSWCLGALVVKALVSVLARHSEKRIVPGPRRICPEILRSVRQGAILRMT